MSTLPPTPAAASPLGLCWVCVALGMRQLKDAEQAVANANAASERIRATEPIMEFGPGRDHENRERAFRSSMAKVSDDLLDALQRAGWGEK